MIRPIAYAAILCAALAAPCATAHDDGAAVEEAVSRAVAPIREQIAEERSRIHLRDAVGGIGYIAGVMGIVAFLKARQGRSAD